MHAKKRIVQFSKCLSHMLVKTDIYRTISYLFNSNSTVQPSETIMDALRLLLGYYEVAFSI